MPREYVARARMPQTAAEALSHRLRPAERYALRDHLADKGVPGETMIEAGLLVSGEDIAVPFDRFRDRLIFPICDSRGRVRRLRPFGVLPRMRATRRMRRGLARDQTLRSAIIVSPQALLLRSFSTRVGDNDRGCG